ncbi:hypothetical protein BGX29_001338 [Mortierella sp. GBA35]|nr:hypothetical protein BGX23_002490 [Mortierella sp. AD031]KAF9086572.1 hypothetical protein BGX29_001338 [Mortierella sp. GBA35]
MCRADTSRRGEWTSEEDALLEQLVRRFIHLPDPSIWHKVAGGQVDNAFLLRSGKSCLRRWRHLHPPSQGQTGRWSMEEDRLMQEAISEQFEGKYQVLVDVFVGQPPAAKDHTLAKRRPQLQQLPSQSELPILKSGSRRLRMLNWVAIAERVQSRTEYECRDHFYSVYHNAEKGSWSEEELERLEEGLKMFEKDYWKIAEHVRTRSPLQVGKLVRYQQRTGKPMQQ